MGVEEIKDVIENTKYPNYCISPSAISIETRDCGDWDDDHPLNNRQTLNVEFDRLFK
jgi:hypothetical protein